MNHIYRLIKIVFLSFLAVFISFILILQRSVRKYHLQLRSPFIKSLCQGSSNFINFILYDPYNNTTLKNLAQNKAKLEMLLSNRQNSLLAFVHDQDFNEQMFSYFISQSIDNLDSIVGHYFPQYPDFIDLIIIDKSENVIYKYGDESFTVKFYPITKQNQGVFLKDKLALIQKNSDQALGYEYEVIALFDYSEFKETIKNMDFPAFAFLGNRLIRSRRFSLRYFKSIKNKLPTLSRERAMSKKIIIFPLKAGESLMGYAGILYPKRSFVSILLILFKLIVLSSLIYGLVRSDRFIIFKIRESEITKSEKKAREENGFDKKKEDENEDEKMTEKNLDWVKNFIEETEDKNERT